MNRPEGKNSVRTASNKTGSAKTHTSVNRAELSFSKGYRLKPETHNLVESLSGKIKGSRDEVINRACRMLENSVNRSNKKKK